MHNYNKRPHCLPFVLCYKSDNGRPLILNKWIVLCHKYRTSCHRCYLIIKLISRCMQHAAEFNLWQTFNKKSNYTCEKCFPVVYSSSFTWYCFFLWFYRVSAGCRWRPSASACLRSTLPSLSCCRRRQTPTHTPWSWSCRSWEITVTRVSRCAVSCLCVHLCLWQSRSPFKEACDLWFIQTTGICFSDVSSIVFVFCWLWCVCVCEILLYYYYSYYLNCSINSKDMLNFF